MVTIKEIDYKNYGKCLSLANESLELIVTVDVGPRIICCRAPGGENLMFNDTERLMSHDVSEAFGEGKNWYIYGGHRMWVSPENWPLSYYPDNEKVVYTIEPNGAVFVPPVQKVTGYAYELSLTLDPEKPEMTLVHRLKNAGEQPFTGAIWALTVSDADGVALVPHSTEDTGLLGNRSLALWPYSDMSDPRVFWGRDYIALRQDRSMENKFKFGLSNSEGAVAYFNHGCALVKRFSADHKNHAYPDFGMSSEFFTNGSFLEVETISPLYLINPGETVEHTERWELTAGVEKPSFDNDSLALAAEKVQLRAKAQK